MLYSIFSLVIYFIPSINNVQVSIPSSQFFPPPSPLSVHTFVLCVSVSASALQIGSSIPFFWFHIQALIYDVCFSLSDLLHSVWYSRSIHASRNNSVSFLLTAEWYSVAWMHHVFLTHSAVDGHLGCFHVLAVVNSCQEPWSACIYAKEWGCWVIWQFYF